MWQYVLQKWFNWTESQDVTGCYLLRNVDWTSLNPLIFQAFYHGKMGVQTFFSSLLPAISTYIAPRRVAKHQLTRCRLESPARTRVNECVGSLGEGKVGDLPFLWHSTGRHSVTFLRLKIVESGIYSHESHDKIHLFTTLEIHFFITRDKQILGSKSACNLSHDRTDHGMDHDWSKKSRYDTLHFVPPPLPRVSVPLHDHPQDVRQSLGSSAPVTWHDDEVGRRSKTSIQEQPTAKKHT